METSLRETNRYDPQVVASATPATLATRTEKSRWAADSAGRTSVDGLANLLEQLGADKSSVLSGIEAGTNAALTFRLALDRVTPLLVRMEPAKVLALISAVGLSQHDRADLLISVATSSIYGLPSRYKTHPGSEAANPLEIWREKGLEPTLIDRVVARAICETGRMGGSWNLSKSWMSERNLCVSTQRDAVIRELCELLARGDERGLAVAPVIAKRLGIRADTLEKIGFHALLKRATATAAKNGTLGFLDDTQMRNLERAIGTRGSAVSGSISAETVKLLLSTKNYSAIQRLAERGLVSRESLTAPQAKSAVAKSLHSTHGRQPCHEVVAAVRLTCLSKSDVDKLGLRNAVGEAATDLLKNRETYLRKNGSGPKDLSILVPLLEMRGADRETLVHAALEGLKKARYWCEDLITIEGDTPSSFRKRSFCGVLDTAGFSQDFVSEVLTKAMLFEVVNLAREGVSGSASLFELSDWATPLELLSIQTSRGLGFVQDYFRKRPPELEVPCARHLKALFDALPKGPERVEATRALAEMCGIITFDIRRRHPEILEAINNALPPSSRLFLPDDRQELVGALDKITESRSLEFGPPQRQGIECISTLPINDDFRSALLRQAMVVKTASLFRDIDRAKDDAVLRDIRENLGKWAAAVGENCVKGAILVAASEDLTVHTSSRPKTLARISKVLSLIQLDHSTPYPGSLTVVYGADHSPNILTAQHMLKLVYRDTVTQLVEADGHSSNSSAEELATLKTLTRFGGVQNPLSEDDAARLYRACSSYPRRATAYRMVMEETGCPPPDDLLKRCILSDSTVARHRYGDFSGIIPDRLLTEHLDAMPHTSVREYARLAALLPASPVWEERFLLGTAGPLTAGHIRMCAGLAVARRDNQADYERFSVPILALFPACPAELRSAVGESLGQLMDAGASAVAKTCADILSKVDNRADTSRPLSDEQLLALEALRHASTDSSSELLLKVAANNDLDKIMAAEIIAHVAKTAPGLFPAFMRAWALNQSSTAEAQAVPLLRLLNAGREIVNPDVSNRFLDGLNMAFESLRKLPADSLEAITISATPSSLPAVIAAWLLGRGSIDDVSTTLRKLEGIGSNTARTDLLNALMYLATPQAKFGEQVFSVFKAIPILSGKDAQVVASALRSLAVVPPLSREIMISEGVLEQLTSASAAEFARNAKEAVQKVRDKLLPGVPATQIGELERTWSNIEPILVYASKLANGMRSSTLNYFCDQVRNFGTGWKAHRYDTIRPVVQAQIGHLSEEALSIWKEDRYAPLGQILLANGASEKPARIAGHLESAIRQGHLAGTGDLQSRLNGVLAAEGIDANKIIQLVSTLQSELEIIDRVIGSQAGAQIEKRLKWLDGRVDKLGMVPVNNKIRENLKELSCFLNEEAKAALELTWSDAEREKQSKISLNEVFPAHFREQLREHVDYLLGDLERLGSEPTFKALFPGSVPNDKVLGEMRRSRKVLGDISRLLQLTADEVSVDRFRDVDDQPVSLSSTIEKLKTFCGNGSPFRQDLDNVAFVLLEGDSGLQTESRRLALVFTDDPELLLQIGKYPLGCGSCQHFDGSVSFNSTLASAVGDAHIKASYIIDLNRLPQEWIAKIDQKDFDTVGPSVPRIHLLNAAVARFLVKSLPVGLFMEPTYTQTNKTDRTLDATINQVMERMLAVPMKKNLLRGGGGDRVDVPASGNPSGQYEDNDALRIQIGPYRMSAQVVSKGKE